jgi:hypothetical protein
MDSKLLPYRTFIVRSSRKHTRPGKPNVVHYTLAVPATGERRDFVSVEAVLEALSVKLAEVEKPE